jgi:predicted transcriptional regulator
MSFPSKTQSAINTVLVLNNKYTPSILSILSKGEKCAGDIAERLGCIHCSAINYLTLALNEGFITKRKEGRKVFYSINKKRLNQVIESLNSIGK